MEPLLIHITKASGILALFYLTYAFFLKQETFYTINRHFLIIGLFSALLLPFVTFTHYIEIAVTPSSYSTQGVALTTPEAVSPLDWTTVLFGIYLLGVLFFATKFILQFAFLLKLIQRNTVVRKGKFHHVEINNPVTPFSFFNHIFYNPQPYSKEELSAIIKHEEAHSSQWHSLDILLTEIFTLFLWINPFSWLYRTTVKQNLEFMADACATKKVESIKDYQYTLLKVSGNNLYSPLVNNFYNSLIKKRIVMLNKSRSNKRNILKIGLIFPVLTLFLVSFNTKDVYVPLKTVTDSTISQTPNQRIEILIDKNTSDKELIQIKKDLLTKGIDFSYTVVHNSKNEIIEISIDFATTKEKGTKMSSSSIHQNGDDPIDPILVLYDEASNSISIGNVDKQSKTHKEEDEDQIVWVTTNDTDGEHKTIEIIDEDGKETIKVNGQKVSRKEFNQMKEDEGVHEKHIKIKKSDDKKSKNVRIVEISEENEDEDIKSIAKNDNIFIVKNDGDKKPLIVIDGVVSEDKAIEEIDPTDIESISVLKDDSAKKKYGKKGKNGVVEITTKKGGEEEEEVKKIEFTQSDNNTKPLFLIDGREVDEKEIKQLDPSDVKTVNVLKDDAAKKKYGKKGQNGVVEITTNKE
ncbi:M56 family metallopeptidase [Maribacter polysiphoniae]|uniref:M56 family metallopeptidase n=1 Tax=Maribacter polysiphoniae TaxID=429344 RepID=UPI002352B160|nr:M56 family metallopeptidase [Maribacter polysiphoniae]